MTLTDKDVSDILKIVDGSDLDEMVIEIAGARLEIRRRGGKAEVAFAPAADAPGAAGPEDPPAAAADGAPAAGGAVEVRAPMVGIFYRRPSPGEPRFVAVGSTVAAGDPLCLIEVMKLFSTIEAPAAGEILEIQAEDGETVEQDQVLFLIRPA